MNSDMDNLLINCLLQQLYVGCAPVYDSPVYFYTHWVNTHIVCNIAWNILFTINSCYDSIKWISNNRKTWRSGSWVDWQQTTGHVDNHYHCHHHHHNHHHLHHNHRRRCHRHHHHQKIKNRRNKINSSYLSTNFTFIFFPWFSKNQNMYIVVNNWGNTNKCAIL